MSGARRIDEKKKKRAREKWNATVEKRVWRKQQQQQKPFDSWISVGVCVCVRAGEALHFASAKLYDIYVRLIVVDGWPSWAERLARCANYYLCSLGAFAVTLLFSSLWWLAHTIFECPPRAAIAVHLNGFPKRYAYVLFNPIAHWRWRQSNLHVIQPKEQHRTEERTKKIKKQKWEKAMTTNVLIAGD